MFELHNAKKYCLVSGGGAPNTGAPPQNPNNMLGIVQFKHHHPRYPKTHLLTCENAARAVRAVQGQVPAPGYLPPLVLTSLGTQPPEYLGG